MGVESAAFCDPGSGESDALAHTAEAARILRELAERLEHDPCDDAPLALRDLNGNRCGVASFKEAGA
jgi:hypothetical protein